MTTQQLDERRTADWDEVIIPFQFFDLSRVDMLDILPGRGHVPIGERERPPFDPFTAWVTMAHLGLIEEGGPLLNAELTREQRLEVARKVLTEDELVIVESIAVPKRYRTIPARELEEMIRTAPDYIDRMWAGCWLSLVGWTESAECTFRDDMSEMPPDATGSELSETIVEAYAESIGANTRDEAGWRRVYDSPEIKLTDRRLGICETHYNLNGPPPYEQMKDTVPLGPGWTQVVRIVPDNPAKV